MPAAIYWRRRLVLVALALAAVWLVLRLTGGDAERTDPSVASAPKPAPAVVPTNGALEVALAADDRSCDPEKVRITPSIPLDQTSGSAVTIDLAVSSTETTPCTLQPADAELIAVISANDTAVFDSTLCTSRSGGGSLLTDPVQLAGGGWATIAPTTWSGRGSGRSCGSAENYAGPGRYTVQVGTLGGEPGKATFALEAAPKPKAKPTKPSPSPTPTKKKKS